MIAICHRKRIFASIGQNKGFVLPHHCGTRSLNRSLHGRVRRGRDPRSSLLITRPPQQIVNQCCRLHLLLPKLNAENAPSATGTGMPRDHHHIAGGGAAAPHSNLGGEQLKSLRDLTVACHPSATESNQRSRQLPYAHAVAYS